MFLKVIRTQYLFIFLYSTIFSNIRTLYCFCLIRAGISFSFMEKQENWLNLAEAKVEQSSQGNQSTPSDRVDGDNSIFNRIR